MSGVVQRISTGYTPRPLQAELHCKLRRFNVLVMHRRFGKTVFALNEKIDRGLGFALKDVAGSPLPNPKYAYLAPLYGQAKRVAWDYLKMYTANIPGVDPNEAELRVDIPRPHMKDKIRFMLLGADNPASIKGLYLDGATLDEFGEMNPSAWREAIRPTLSDRGGWANFIGTPKGRNHFCELYEYARDSGDPEWFAALYKASETGIIPEKELESARKSMTEEEYEQEYECSFQAGLVGAYFSREITQLEKDKKFTSVPYDPALAVDTYWDLGINDVTAIWFIQRYGREFRVIDYFEEPDLSIPEIVKRVREKRYTWGHWYLPHDVKVRELVNGKSRYETFISLGVKPRIVPRVEDKMDSINAAKLILPRCVFDKEKCDRGIKALMNYQRKWDNKANVFSTKPLHNWASNGSDAFQQFAMGVDERPEVDHRSLPRQAESEYDYFS